MKKDLFTHLESTMKLQVQLIGVDGDPLDMEDVTVKFGVAEDVTGETLEILDLSDGISIINPAQAVIEIDFTPKKANGFKNQDLVYQVQVTIVSQLYTYVALEGRIFITASLFD